AAFKGKYEFSVEVLPIQKARFFPAFRDSIISIIWTIGAVMAVILSVACLSLVNLLIARTTTREQELTVRLALGASRARLLRQLAIESLLLCLFGGVAAIGVAEAAWLAFGLFGRPLRVVLPPQLQVDFQMVVFMAVLTLIVGLFFAI